MNMDLIIIYYYLLFIDVLINVIWKYIIFRDYFLFIEIRDIGGREGGLDEWRIEIEDRNRSGFG